MVLTTNTVEVFVFLSIKVVYQGSCFIYLNIKTNHFFSSFLSIGNFGFSGGRKLWSLSL